MRRILVRSAIGGTVAALALGGFAVIADQASAGTIDGYFGASGGSQIRIADASISSDLSASSVIAGTGKPGTDSHSTVSLNISGLLNTGLVTTSATISAISGGTQLTTVAKTANVSLLNGLITADAVTSTSTVTKVNGVYSATSHSTFLNLKVAGFTLPLTIPQNFGLTIPGVASVVLNTDIDGSNATSATAIGAGLSLTLLHSAGNVGSGAQVYLAPTLSTVASGQAPPVTGHAITGGSYATKVSANATSAVQVTSDPTAAASVPGAGNNQVNTASVLSVNVFSALNVGVATDTATGTNTKAGATAQTTSTVAHVSLLNGLITADALTTTAKASVKTGKATTTSGSFKLVNLVIAGKTIPLTVKPNTTISLGALGKVVLNEQDVTSTGITVMALHVVLSTAAFGLDVGADLQVGVSSAYAS